MGWGLCRKQECEGCRPQCEGGSRSGMGLPHALPAETPHGWEVSLRGSTGQGRQVGNTRFRATPTTHHVVVRRCPALTLPPVEGAVVPCDLLPGAMEVIGHEVDEIQVPALSWGAGRGGWSGVLPPAPPPMWCEDSRATLGVQKGTLGAALPLEAVAFSLPHVLNPWDPSCPLRIPVLHWRGCRSYANPVQAVGDIWGGASKRETLLAPVLLSSSNNSNTKHEFQGRGQRPREKVLEAESGTSVRCW